jgi:hypothetical protein
VSTICPRIWWSRLCSSTALVTAFSVFFSRVLDEKPTRRPVVAESSGASPANGQSAGYLGQESDSALPAPSRHPFALSLPSGVKVGMVHEAPAFCPLIKGKSSLSFQSVPPPLFPCAGCLPLSYATNFAKYLPTTLLQCTRLSFTRSFSSLWHFLPRSALYYLAKLSSIQSLMGCLRNVSLSKALTLDKVGCYQSTSFFNFHINVLSFRNILRCRSWSMRED